MSVRKSVITIHAARQALGGNAESLLEHVKHRIVETSESFSESYIPTLIVVDQIVGADAYIQVDDHTNFTVLVASGGMSRGTADVELIRIHEQTLQEMVDALKTTFNMKVRLVKNVVGLHTFVVTSSS